MPIYFTIPVAPLSVQFGGRRVGFSKSRRPVFFKDKRVEGWIEAVQLYANKYRPREPLSGVVHLKVVFVLPRPKSLSRKKDPEGRIWAPVRPDHDNLIKGLQDALTGFCLDDCQICVGTQIKLYCAKGEEPKMEISIDQLNEYQCYNPRPEAEKPK
jgi:Holliday junction resolvase RusA-like endonuclease